MKTKHIRIDTTIADDSIIEVHKLLKSGWRIIDTIITEDRYVFYILEYKGKV